MSGKISINALRNFPIYYIFQFHLKFNVDYFNSSPATALQSSLGTWASIINLPLPSFPQLVLRHAAELLGRRLCLHTTTKHRQTNDKHPCHQSGIPTRDPVYNSSRPSPHTARPPGQVTIVINILKLLNNQQPLV
jgi:hypothetical protein